MTYNFDPDRWFEREEAALRERWRRQEIDDDGLAAELERLAERLEAMLERLEIRHDYGRRNGGDR